MDFILNFSIMHVSLFFVFLRFPSFPFRANFRVEHVKCLPSSLPPQPSRLPLSSLLLSLFWLGNENI